jgi:hypothetical protein
MKLKEGKKKEFIHTIRKVLVKKGGNASKRVEKSIKLKV